MYDSDSTLNVIRQWTLVFFVFLFLASSQRGCTYDSYTKPCNGFDWVEFENSVDKKLFYNVHRMNKDAFHILLNQILPNLRNKYKDLSKLRVPYASMLGITLSYLGGARICNLRVLYCPIKTEVIFSYI